MLAADEGIWPPSLLAWRPYSSLMGRRRKRYCPSDLPLRSIPPTALCCSFAEWSQAVLSFGPSASLHPPTPDGAVPPAYGRGWPGSSGQHCLRPCHPLLPFIAKVARISSAYGRGWRCSLNFVRVVRRPFSGKNLEIWNLLSILPEGSCLVQKKPHYFFATTHCGL